MSISAAPVALPLESATVDETRQSGGLRDDVHLLWQQLLELAHDRLQLAALETAVPVARLIATARSRHELHRPTEDPIAIGPRKKGSLRVEWCASIRLFTIDSNVYVCRTETLQAASKLAHKNSGTVGVEGVACGGMEISGRGRASNCEDVVGKT